MVAYLVIAHYRDTADDRAYKAAERKNLELLPVQIEALENHFPFYQTLNPEEQILFRKRLAYFLTHKKFVAYEGLELFESMKALIGAEAIRITFGLRYFLLPHFRVIRVFPKEYFSEVTQNYHKGEVNLKGAITFAWSSFAEGITIPHDGVNVAIHEFAHAVYFENFIKNREYLFINPELLHIWNEFAELEMPQMKKDESHFIRAYGSSNRDEFFAVSTEHFFEQPVDFEQEHPDLYLLLTKIYNQNPAERLKIHS